MAVLRAAACEPAKWRPASRYAPRRHTVSALICVGQRVRHHIAVEATPPLHTNYPLITVVVGNPAAFERPLSTLGTVTTMRLEDIRR